MDFEIQFSDVVLLEANGEYLHACRIMKKPTKNGFIQDIYVEKWMIESTISITNPFGYAQLTCHFYYDGTVMVADYNPTVPDIHNPDIRCLSYWAQNSGWKVPQPLPALVKTWLDFWKHQWETFIIDSDYLDSKYGARDKDVISEMRSVEEDDDDIDLDLEDLSHLDENL